MFFNYNKIFFIQLIQYIFLFSSFILGLAFGFKLFNLAFFYTLIQSIIFRIISIAGKYSSFDSNYIKRIREVKISLIELESKLLLNKWRLQNDILVQEQINFSLDRNEIEKNYFYISFFYNPNNYFYEKSKFKKENVKVSLKDGMEFHFFSCVEIFKYLNEKYNKKIKFTKFKILTYFLTIFRVVTPLFFVVLDNYIKKKNLFDFIIKLPYYEIIIFLLSSNILMMLYMTFFNFFVQFIIDIDRMKFILSQLTEMIQIKKISLRENIKIFPTINIFSEFSLNNWGNLRILVNDYGTDYLLRNKIFVASITFIWCYLFLFLIIIEYFNDELKNKLTIFEHTIVFEFFLVFFLLLVLIYKGASYNQIFSSHKNKLNNLKILIKKYKTFKHFYRDGQDLKTENIDINIFKTENNSNFLYLKFDNILRKILNNNFDDQLNNYLENIINNIDNLIEIVDYEENTKNINIFGITWNYELFNILIFGLLPIILELFKEYFQRNFINT